MKYFFWIAALTLSLKVSATYSNDANRYLLMRYDAIKGTFGKPAFDLYAKGVTGYLNLARQGRLSDKNLLTLIDFRESSNVKRIWVIDMNKDSIIYHNLVSHGRNTGNEFARAFSDTPNSNKSSLGFYVTGENYQGKHGLSLRLDGAEPGFNSNARTRAIVMHSATYVDPAYTRKYGRIGRSLGCPAIPVRGHQELLRVLEGRTCLFIYYPDPAYLAGTKLQDGSVINQVMKGTKEDPGLLIMR